MAGLLFEEKECLEVISERVQRGFLLERKGRVTPRREAEDRQHAGTNSGKSGTRILEAESSRVGSTGGDVKLKTVTEIKRSSARDTFIAESVYLTLNSLWDRKPVKRLEQRSDMGSFTFFRMRQAAQFSMRRRLWIKETGRPERRQLQQSRRDRMSEVTSFTVVTSFSGIKILPDPTDSTELVVAGFGGLSNKVFHERCAV